MGLCHCCQEFDVRALLIAAEAAPTRPNTNDAGLLVSAKRGLIRNGISKYFAHQPNLTALRASAAECDFCLAIWNQYQAQRKPFELTDTALAQGVGGEQVYLGTENWDTGLSSVPNVVVVQQGPPPHNTYRQLACFDVCVQYGNEPNDHVHLLARLQAKSAADESCVSLARKWLKTCSEGHPTCQRSYETDLRFPTRVVDVCADGGNAARTKACLVDGLDRKEPYTALSYCWGPDRALILTHESEKTLREGIPISDFPGTLQDAIIVTQKLGFRYVWIDALCIFQDQQEYQESRDDWARESARMRDVYRGAIVTIEAASASRGSQGFLKQRPHSNAYCALPWKSPGSSCVVHMRALSDIPDSQLLGTTIFSRGWTLQERVLAPRTLSFGRQQVSFECAHGFVDEIGRSLLLPRATESYLSKQSMSELRADKSRTAKAVRSVSQLLGVPPVIDFAGLSTRWTSQGLLEIPGGYWATYYDYWRGIIERFTERQLTSNADRLPALSGLADEFQRATRDTYIAGMWKNELLTSLAWTCSRLYNPQGNYANYPGIPPSNFVNGPYPEAAKSSKYIAPSWSWASVQGRVTFFLKPYYQKHDITSYAKIKSVDTVPVLSADQLGGLSGGSLKLAAPFLHIPSPFQACQDHEVKMLHDLIRRDHGQQGADHVSEVYQHHEAHEGQTFGLVKLFHDAPQEKVVAKVLRLLLVESCSGGGFRRLTCVEVQLATLDDLERGFFRDMKVIADSDKEAFAQAKPSYEIIAAISTEVSMAKWERKTITIY